MPTELCKEYPIVFGSVLAATFLIAQAVLIAVVDDPLADKMLEWIFYVSAALCVVRVAWAAFCLVSGKGKGSG